MNAKEFDKNFKPNILALGSTGSGKTTQILTLPGKKFVYAFDSNAMMALRGFDIEVEEFFPDLIDLKLTSLSAENRKRAGIRENRIGTQAYNEWEKDFETRLKDGYFNDFDVICLDSLTTLSDLIMDGVLAINGRGGQWPQQDDYGPQMLAITKICRTFVSMDKIIYFTGHLEVKQDDLTKRILQWPMLTGKLKGKLPLMFSEVLVFDAQSDGAGKTAYKAQCRPDRMNTTVRTSVREAPQFVDISLDFSKPLHNQGLGKFLFNTK